MKARITVRQSTNANCYVLLNGGHFAVVHANDVKKGIMARIERLQTLGCNWSAEQLLKCIRLN